MDTFRISSQVNPLTIANSAGRSRVAENSASHERAASAAPKERLSDVLEESESKGRESGESGHESRRKIAEA